MTNNTKHNFGENTEEFSPKVGKKVPVIAMPKFKQAKAKAEEMIDCGKYGLSDGDFWILQNATKNGDKMCYTGLILSHNGCLKINDRQDEGKRFVPSCVTVDKDGFNKSLVYTYCNDAQGIYEVGEANAANCKNEYIYAMAYKRLFDRVVLKLCKLAYDGIYSDSESDEFKEPDEHKESVVYEDPMDAPFEPTPTLKQKIEAKKAAQEAAPPWDDLKVTPEDINHHFGKFSDAGKAKVCKQFGLSTLADMTYAQLDEYKRMIAEAKAKKS